MKGLLVPVILTLILFPVAGSGTNESAEITKISAFVSILPQVYFLERIGGEYVEVEVMVLPGKSPATYEPTPRQMIALSSAQVFFTIGVPFERAFIPTLKSTLPDLSLVDTARGIELRHLKSHKHEDDEEHEEQQEGFDPHVWMSPLNAKIIARNMAAFLIAQDRENQAFYQKNLEDLEQDLNTLHKQMKEVLAPYEGEILFVYHPAFGYLADLYGLEQETIELGGKQPAPAQLEEIIEHARKENVHVLFVQPEFSQSSAEAVARAINGKVITVAPLKKEYLENLEEIARTLAKELQ